MKAVDRAPLNAEEAAPRFLPNNAGIAEQRWPTKAFCAILVEEGRRSLPPSKQWLATQAAAMLPGSTGKAPTKWTMFAVRFACFFPSARVGDDPRPEWLVGREKLAERFPSCRRAGRASHFA
jgi:hypothetical protein